MSIFSDVSIGVNIVGWSGPFYATTTRTANDSIRMTNKCKHIFEEQRKISLLNWKT